jgi:hypothetical protein
MALQAETVLIPETVSQAETPLHSQTETVLLHPEVILKINLEVLTVKAEQTLLLKVVNVLIAHQAITLIEVAEVVCLLVEVLDRQVAEVVAEADRQEVEDKNYRLILQTTAFVCCCSTI